MNNLLDYIISFASPTDKIGQGYKAVTNKNGVKLYSGVNDSSDSLPKNAKVIATRNDGILLGTIQRVVRNEFSVVFCKIKLVVPIKSGSKTYTDAWCMADDVDYQIINTIQKDEIYWIKRTELSQVRAYKKPEVGTGTDIITTFYADDIVGQSTGVVRNGFVNIKLIEPIGGVQFCYVDETKLTKTPPVSNRGSEENPNELPEVVVKGKRIGTTEDSKDAHSSEKEIAAVKNLPIVGASDSSETYYIDRIEYARSILFKFIGGLIIFIFLILLFNSTKSTPQENANTGS